MACLNFWGHFFLSFLSMMLKKLLLEWQLIPAYVFVQHRLKPSMLLRHAHAYHSLTAMVRETFHVSSGDLYMDIQS